MNPRLPVLNATKLGRWLLAAGLMLWAGSAQADSMSCGVNLVVVGDYKLEVEDACGKPDDKESHFIDGAYQARDRYGRRILVDGIRVETWTYRFGPQRFARILRFENGRLVRIDKARRRL